jgi:N-formylglutamate amidohydrolase
VATDSAPRPLAEIVGDPSSPVLATAIHAGHDLRPEVDRRLALDEATRFREEDPFTDRFTTCADTRLVVNRSRFEVDLNRGRDEAVYREPDDAWGLDLWRGELPDEVVEGSLDLHDAFYETLAAHLDALAERGPFVVFDLHSYNHRRQGPEAPPDPPEENPDVNVGTASLDRDHWGDVVDTFIEVMRRARIDGAALDVRENVRFGGAHLARWVHERYSGTGCALALEMKKTFMDEWTGRLDAARLEALTAALRPTVPAVLEVVRAST